MIRIVQGLVFEVPSPSFWKLSGEPVDIDYLGDRWYLFCNDERGQKCAMPVPSRDAGIAMVAKAFRNTGRIP